MTDTTALLAPHHGAHTHVSNHEAWIEVTNPQIVVFSTGTCDGYPRPGIFQRYQAVQTNIVVTHRIWWSRNSTE